MHLLRRFVEAIERIASLLEAAEMRAYRAEMRAMEWAKREQARLDSIDESQQRVARAHEKAQLAQAEFLKREEARRERADGEPDDTDPRPPTTH